VAPAQVSATPPKTVYAYTERSLTRDGQAWTPMMGEIHYSRLTPAQWPTSLATMKAGGVDIVSSYIIWLHHQETTAAPSFADHLDLRRFVAEVAEQGLLCWLRLGPWVHAEVRHGGFPDWLVESGAQLRSDDPAYLDAVGAFWRAIFSQVDGLFLDQGGPIIGLQIENEYGHCGGLTGPAGETHMRTLRSLAEEIGFRAPYWSATGWGGGITAGMLPVMGGYAEAPWDHRLGEIEPSSNFVFSPERDDHAIGSDFGHGDHLTFDPALYPYLTAELGGGLQPTSHRRPLADADDVAVMSLVKLGSGAALLGYYMYHGGINPLGRLSSFEETTTVGDYNQLPLRNYDFQAPLGAYGQINPSWQRLRWISAFLRHYGPDLASMTTIFPTGNPQEPSDAAALRHTIRHNGQSGFVFVNNYTRQPDRPDFLIDELTVAGRQLPAFSVAAGEYGVYPVNLAVTAGLVEFAQAMPVGQIGDTTLLIGRNLQASLGAKVALIDWATAEQAYLVDGHLRRSQYPIIGDCQLVTRPDARASANLRQLDHWHWQIDLGNLSDDADDYALQINWRGDYLSIKADGVLIDDAYWLGKPHLLGLNRWGRPSKLELAIKPLRPDTAVFLPEWPQFDGPELASIDQLTVLRIDRRPVPDDLAILL
jgi:hypothetical protein